MMMSEGAADMYAPPRYDDVYYPRTDKRMISKIFMKIETLILIGGNQYTYEGNRFNQLTFQG